MEKSQLINAIRNYLNNKSDVKEILFHGIIDREIINCIEEVMGDIEKSIEIKVVIPKLRNLRSIGWLKNHKDSHCNYEIRTNHKCCSQFIIMNDTFIFISGNGKITTDSFAKDSICFLEEDNLKACEEVLNIFSTNWNNGFHLVL